MSRRLVGTAGLAAVSLLTVAGCAGGTTATGGESPSASLKPVAGGTLVVSQSDIPPCLDAAITPYANAAGRAVVDNLFDQDLKTGEPVPWLATGATVSDDGLTYTISLRDGVTFSNGEPFDADAVKRNFDNAIEFRKTDGRGVAAANLAGYTGSEVVDAHTLKVTFDEPKAGFLQSLTEKALGIAWPGSIEGKDYDTRCKNGVIGTGPFVISENVNDDHITLTKRKGYDWASPTALHQGDAYLDEVKFVEIPEAGVQIESLLAGEIDAATSFATPDIARIKAAGYQIDSRVSAGVADTLYPNLDRLPFSDLAVRQAFQIGFDRQAINKAVLNEYSPPAKSPISTPVPGFVDLSAKLAYDPTAAGKLLDKAGWVPGPDGIRVKDGTPLSAVLLFSSENDRPFNQLLQSELKEIGFDLQVQQATTAEVTARQVAGDWDLTKGNFTRADPDVLLNTYHPDFVTNARTKHETVPDLEKLLDEQRVQLDQKKRSELVADALDTIVTKGYGFPVNESGRSIAHSPTTHGYTYTLPGWNLFYDVWKDAGS